MVSGFIFLTQRANKNVIWLKTGDSEYFISNQ